MRVGKYTVYRKWHSLSESFTGSWFTSDIKSAELHGCLQFRLQSHANGSPPMSIKKKRSNLQCSTTLRFTQWPRYPDSKVHTVHTQSNKSLFFTLRLLSDLFMVVLNTPVHIDKELTMWWLFIAELHWMTMQMMTNCLLHIGNCHRL